MTDPARYRSKRGVFIDGPSSNFSPACLARIARTQARQNELEVARAASIAAEREKLELIERRRRGQREHVKPYPWLA